MNKVHAFLLIGLFSYTGTSYGGGSLPDGWNQFTKSEDSQIEAGVDKTIFHSEPSSFYIKSISGKGGNIYQTISNQNYAGKRIRFSAYLKSDNIINDNGYGGFIFVNSYPPSRKEVYLTGSAGELKGTTDWAEYSIVFDVPTENSENSIIDYGVSITGQGTIWFDSIKWEVVDKTKIPLKNVSVKSNKITEPKNLP